MKKMWIPVFWAALLVFCGKETKQVGTRFEKSDFATAQQKTLSDNKPLLAYFYTEW